MATATCQPVYPPDRRLARFTITFDRAGYSPEFVRRVWEQRIAVIISPEHPAGWWAEQEVRQRKVRLVNGQEGTLRLAGWGVLLSNGFGMREVRPLEEAGHQVWVLSGDHRRSLGGVAVVQWGRWCQENFLQLRRRH
jgi:hypothetical protein